MKNIYGFIIILIFAFGSCQKPDEGKGKAEIHPIVQKLQQKYAPDQRVAIFDLMVIEEGNKVTLKGEVDRTEAKEEALAAFQAQYSEVLDSIEVLPSSALGEKTWGVITVSVANMRTKTGEGAELGTQALMGNIVRIWKKRGGYYYIQTPDKYLGWADGDQLHHMTEQEAEEWNKAKKMFFTGFNGMILQQPVENAYPVSDITGGGIVRDLGGSGAWNRVGLADGRVGFIPKKDLIDYAEWGSTLHPVAANIERTGRFMMGVPYLWGGTSAKGVDCSGFTKTVYLLNGILLDRDANQQAEQGTPVEAGEQFSNLKKGDLLFFGRKATEEKKERISHVGIYLGNKEYIHSSGKVQINSFDKNSPLYNEYNLERFVRARRIIASVPQMSELKLK
ncbi:MAG: NlpC/P60 family protein [Bacteroidota bacterium]